MVERLILGGPLDNRSVLVDRSLHNLHAPVLDLVLTPAEKEKPPKRAEFYDYVLACDGEFSAFVPTSDNDLASRFGECDQGDLESGDQAARLLRAEMIRRGLPTIPQRDYGPCEVPGCAASAAGWHSLGVAACEVHYMLHRDELDALFIDAPGDQAPTETPTRS